ncbi:kinase-like domain-containing protein, partial [Cytidiella melzeri]
IGDGLLVKHGPGVRMTEVHNTVYARARTSIPIPTVHLAFRIRDTVYIVMDLVRGGSLLRRWTTLTKAELSSVLSQLRNYLHELQQLKGATPGPVDGSRLEGPWFTFFGKDPFPTYDDLIAWLNRMLKHSKADHLVDPFSVVHPLVFTHQDISPRNLILDDMGKLWVIDWDRAGRYPAYFE